MFGKELVCNQPSFWLNSLAGKEAKSLCFYGSHSAGEHGVSGNTGPMGLSCSLVIFGLKKKIASRL